ncbi:hypothetical protein NVP1149O_10 [Vibrio phage 1.149.O._10N.286.55.A12]|nr:hypothetical protein NVP1149O_10 [Vibrio phage 1.149.O._10N.286.55.A12]
MKIGDAIKVGDQFKLPVRIGDRGAIVQDDGDRVDYSKLDLMVSCIAINNHDRMVEEIAALKGAIEAAVRIKELWLPTIAFSDNPPEHYAEIEALHKMANKFEIALAKLSKDK